MKLSDILMMCGRNLSRSKSRTFLTVIGVVVGTCSIVVMISLGIGYQASADAMLAEMGDLTMIQVYNYGGRGESGESLTLDDAVLADIASRPHVLVASPFYQSRYLDMSMVSGRNDRYQMGWAELYGVTPNALEYLGFSLMEGSFDLTTSARNTVAVVIGQHTDYSFNDTKRRGDGRWRYEGMLDSQGNPIPPFVDMRADEITMVFNNRSADSKPIKYEIAVNGRLEFTSNNWESYQAMFMDINALKELEKVYMKANKIQEDDSQDAGYDNVRVKVDDLRYVEEVETYIKGLGYETYSMETVRKPLQEEVQKQQLIFGFVGAMALVVAAIGIANTMFMSILERTREIGIMKVVGCFVRDIRVAFLTEASAIGLLGGVAGIVMSFGISWLMNTFGFSLGNMGGNYYAETAAPTNVSIIPSWLVLTALMFSTLIGLVSGYLPANRAVKIEALEAIKHE